MDKEIEGTDVAVGAVGSEGERRSSTLSMARDGGAVGALAPGQRWSLSRKRDVVLRLMQGEPVEGMSRRLGLPVYTLEEWRQRGAFPLARTSPSSTNAFIRKPDLVSENKRDERSCSHAVPRQKIAQPK